MANLNLNKVILAGRLTAEPELKQTQSGISVLSFSIAVNRRYVKSTDGQQAQQQTDFINLVAWRQTAEFISRFFHKGSSICVTGSIQVRPWQDQQGQKRYSTEVVVDEAMFVDSKGESTSGGQYTPDAYSAPSFSSGADEAPKFEEVNTDESFLPF
ncbi:MAG: single-stranded DNA-binding protein [Ruminococcaceae bacterium]|nr:single-stranded DNA-binding protein [Oscillospiraceae bacterium]